MRADGATVTRVGRVVYDRPPHFFTAKAVVRIVGELMHDNQLSGYERKQIASLLYPAVVTLGEDDISLFEQVRDYLLEKVLGKLDLALPLVTWLVDLEIEQVTEFLKSWAKALKE